MNQELIDMARKAGLKVTSNNEILPSYLGSVSDGYFKLAKLVAAAEREACAKIVEPTEEHRREASWGYLGGEEGVELLDAKVKEIRARGETK